MTALFVVIFVEQWMNKSNRIPELTGIIASVICLQFFGAEQFVLPSMLLIIMVLFFSRKRLEGKGERICQ